MKVRQPIRARETPATVYLGRVLVALVALALVWYGLTVVLLALKVAPGSVNAISGYRSMFDYFSGLEPADITDRARLVAGLAGFAVFVVCSLLAWRELPRPYLARSDLALLEDSRSTITVKPRVLERAAEAAAVEHPAVIGAAARYGDDLSVDIEVDRGLDLAQTLAETQQLVAQTLSRLELPAPPVSVTVTGFDRRRRELH